LHVHASAAAAARACAIHIAELLVKRLCEAELVTLAVSGGSTPAMMFRVLATCPVEWKRVHLFQVDERMVPPGDAQSNYRMTQAELIAPAGIAPENVHRVHGEWPAQQAASGYVAEIRQFFGTADGMVPAFDIVHRGMGGESHTASLFPGEPLIGDTTGIAAAVIVPATPHGRVTLLPGPLTSARHTAMLVAGEDKAQAMQWVMGDEYAPLRFPAQIGTWRNENAQWFVDTAAVALLPS